MKILLVEDNEKLNEATRIYLSNQGFDVDVAFNGVQAISKVKDFLKKNNSEYDIIILDRMMPMKDGVETFQEIKNLNIKSNIFFLTAKDSVEDKVYGLTLGADDYIVKPFNVKELTARLHSVYRRRLQEKENEYFNSSILTNYLLEKNSLISFEKKNSYRKEDYKQDNFDSVTFEFDFNLNLIKLKFINLDKKNNKKIKNEKEIYLTGKEASIFNFLLENKNNFISKEIILNTIWKDNKSLNSRFVDVHVHNLRNKLIKNNFPGKIETMRNAGYKLIIKN